MTSEPKGAFSAGDSHIDEQPKDASTVLLVRDASELEVFLVRRHHKSAFMGGAYVFPGGKLDDEDWSKTTLEHVSPKARRWAEARLDETPALALDADKAVGLAVAAVRELFEEAGVLLAERIEDGRPFAIESDEERSRFFDWRHRIHEGEARFSQMLEDERLVLAFEGLHYWAHWITPSQERRRFDTRFFLARMPDNQTPLIDQKETVDQAWLSPTAALAAHQRGELFLPPPTLRNLEDFGDARQVAQLLAQADAREIVAILPKLLLDQDRIAIVLPWDPEYEIADGESLPIDFRGHPLAVGASRLYIDGGQFQAAKKG